MCHNYSWSDFDQTSRLRAKREILWCTSGCTGTCWSHSLPFPPPPFLKRMHFLRIIKRSAYWMRNRTAKSQHKLFKHVKDKRWRESLRDAGEHGIKEKRYLWMYFARLTRYQKHLLSIHLYSTCLFRQCKLCSILNGKFLNAMAI